MALHWDPEQFVQRMRERRYRAVLDDPPECSLAELRKSCHKTQADVASTLGVRQLAVSRLERSRNVRLGALSVYVAALGGHLELTVRFPRRAVRLKRYVIALQHLGGTMRRASLAGLLAVAAWPLAAQAPPRRPAWEWSNDTIQRVVNAVRAGRSLQPKQWPDGARVAVLLSFDVDNETIALRTGEPSVGALSQGEYGARVALRRVVELVDRHSIPASFFIPAVSLMLHPDMADVIKRSGRHEFGVHGWIHETNTTLTAEVERDLVKRALDYLTTATGSRPVGYRAPSWNFSPNTLTIIRELGFLYESSMMSDDRPYELLQNGQPTGLVELPVEWILDDAPLFNVQGANYASPREVAEVWKDEFNKAWDEGTMFLLTMHPHVIGHRSRIVALELLLDHIRAKGKVWFATHRGAVEYVKREAGMKN